MKDSVRVPKHYRSQGISDPIYEESADIRGPQVWEGRRQGEKKSYDTFFDFEILVFSEMGANSAIFESGLTPIASLKLTLEGSKNV